jgi:hypothetical protein
MPSRSACAFSFAASGPLAGDRCADQPAVSFEDGERLDQHAAGLKRVAQLVKARVHAEFSLPAMVDGGLAAYREALALRKLAQFA